MNSLSTSGPMRVPLPAATIMAEVILRARSPVQDFELHAHSAIVLVDLGGESQVEGSHGKRFLARAPPDRFERGGAVRDPHLDVLLVRAQALQWPLMCQMACAEVDRWVSLADGFQLLQLGHAVQSHFVQTDLRIEP